MNDKIIPVYILTGFLGSGKTTLLNRILEDAREQGLKPAVMLNEVGEVNVEGQLIEKEIPMSEMLGGCICCSIKGDLGMELMRLAHEHRPDVIWIESTGIAQPLEIMDGVTEASLYAKLELKNIITLVDGRHLLDRLRIGTGKTFKLMKEQIRAASILILNKTDLIREDELNELHEALTAWNPYARIVQTTRSQVDPSILYAAYGNVEKNHEHQLSPNHVRSEACRPDCSHDHTHTHSLHDHVNVTTYYFKGKVDSVAFEAFLKQLPDEIYRAKGIVAFKDTASQFLFQYAYREIDFLRITPQKMVNDVAVFIGEGFSHDELLAKLEKLDLV